MCGFSIQVFPTARFAVISIFFCKPSATSSRSFYPRKGLVKLSCIGNYLLLPYIPVLCQVYCLSLSVHPIGDLPLYLLFSTCPSTIRCSISAVLLAICLKYPRYALFSCFNNLFSICSSCSMDAFIMCCTHYTLRIRLLLLLLLHYYLYLFYLSLIASLTAQPVL